MENPAIAALFDEMADLLELDGAVVFRVRAYRNAARVIQDLGTPLRDLAGDLKALMELEGIGRDLAEKIQEIVHTGDFAAHRELRAKFLQVTSPSMALAPPVEARRLERVLPIS
jgi:DNA polymerase (family 10)